MIPSGAKVFLASHPVDFRKGPDGLMALVRDAGADPFNGALYVFRAKRADRIKIVWWDGSGLCLYAKRLEKAQFCWPRIGHSRVQLNQAQLLALVDGLDWKRVRPVLVKRPQSAG
ncbi:MAG: IS66 family insertion sequence element accessory protein TnpB [Rhizobiaceae bacterium]|jgi:transposase|nr:IS66 family insertion sequence element accessory protein TnpB [Rhizobiaceae bacterium]